MSLSKRHPTILRPDNTLLVAIDLQEPFLRGVTDRESVLARCELLVEGCSVLRVPVLPTVQNAERLGPPVSEIARLLPAACGTVDKLCFSCAGSEPFLAEVRRSGRKQILLCGVETHICVCQTALDLLNEGYQVHVASDAVSSRSEENRRAGLRRMEAAGAIPSSAEMAIYELLGEAGTPEFREILRLIKSAST